METLDELIKKLPHTIYTKPMLNKYKLNIWYNNEGWHIKYFSLHLYKVLSIKDNTNSIITFSTENNDFRTIIEDIITKIYQNKDKLELEFVN